MCVMLSLYKFIIKKALKGIVKDADKIGLEQFSLNFKDGIFEVAKFSSILLDTFVLLKKL